MRKSMGISWGVRKRSPHLMRGTRVISNAKSATFGSHAANGVVPTFFHGAAPRVRRGVRHPMRGQLPRTKATRAARTGRGL